MRLLIEGKEVDVRFVAGKLVVDGKAIDQNTQHHIDLLPNHVVIDSRPISMQHLFENDAREGIITSPLNGMVAKVLIKENQQIKKGETLLIVEAMKMENHVNALKDGIIDEVCVKAGEAVKEGQELLKMKK
jgi:3-methylcrotonyl-CoA carboxylase alpha subunit